MPRSVKLRLVPIALLAALATLLAAGCGGGDGGGGDPAELAPARTPLYIDFTIQPEGETRANIEALAKKIAGVDDLGGLIVEELESSAADEGEEFDFEKEVEPWLGEKAGFIYPKFDEGDFDGFWVAIQVNDSGAAEAFLEKHSDSDEGPAEKSSYEGVDFWVEDDGDASGVIDDLLVATDSEALFKEAVDASSEESLSDEDAFSSAMANVPGDSAADVYADIGTMIRESGDEVDPSARAFFENAGIELNEATAVASLVPGSDSVEIDVSTSATGDNPPAGDASEILSSLPANSLFAFGSVEFGKRFNEGLEQLDERGIPDEGIGPHELKKGLKETGVDLEGIASSIGDAGAFVTGSNEQNLGGALVLTADDAQRAKNTVSNIGLFLRGTGIPGITAISGKASGFSIRNSELGRQPVVVAAKGSRIAIGYGLDATLEGLAESQETLGDSPTYREAVSALGSTPISAFLDGPAALNLASSLVPPYEEGFQEAKPYLEKIDYIAIGSESSGDLATTKLIVGIGK